MQVYSYHHSYQSGRIVSVAIACSFIAHVFLLLYLSFQNQPPQIRPLITTYHLDLVSKDAGDQPETNLLPEPVQPSKAQKQEEKSKPTEKRQEVSQPKEKSLPKLEKAVAKESVQEQRTAEPSQDLPPVKEEVVVETQHLAEPRIERKSASEPTPAPDEAKEIVSSEVVSESTKETSEEDSLPSPSSPKYEIGTANNPRPKYPGIARKRGWQGTVVIGVTVGTDGRADKIIIIDSSDVGVFDYAAYETVMNEWVFDPAEYLGQPVEGYIEVPIAFQLQ